MISTKTRITTKEKQKLRIELLSYTILKPIKLALFYMVIVLLFLPFLPIIPSKYDIESPVDSIDEYFVYIVQHFFNLPKKFLILLMVAFPFYWFGNVKLIIDLIRDNVSNHKFLEDFKITKKHKKSSTYYLITNNSNFPKIKTNKTIFDKIEVNDSVKFVVSKSNRVYRYNPSLENFKLEKLI